MNALHRPLIRVLALSALAFAAQGCASVSHQSVASVSRTAPAWAPGPDGANAAAIAAERGGPSSQWAQARTDDGRPY